MNSLEWDEILVIVREPIMWFFHDDRLKAFSKLTNGRHDDDCAAKESRIPLYPAISI